MDTTKREARDLLQTNDAGLAKFFGITPGAVSQWRDDDPLPRERQWQIRAMRPDLFPAPTQAGEVADAA
ncbi:hypothetical protein EA658_16540 [Pseudoxanthomonas winnipegensis]|uniref:Uncharacterized protein n=1 Tax=Pseudoxanthomonas winnipegensis TaxID=2480810 RepID=A0ABY1WCH2_9GAMM|nr:Cro/CI family transcriptional regulator [Pseudoxanthomonas winnipegensis]TAA11271.1 hypothetical protein EA659_07955 [Pseudoxanthomonas winnipegensis]TAA18694.1 hypothetical protein EA658_16540 [Pseudoxanthomonas winnipegensis]TAH73930.1 hypothetical protein EA657_00205 [Pseudoxanthomonas winnipegensis]